MSWKFIKDPIHNYIRIRDEEFKIIDTGCFQRLRNIYHLGTGYLTYPGATHSRFEHSLGVMQLAGSIFDNMVENSINDKLNWWKKVPADILIQMKNELRYASLLHDIGHAPFSHTCEYFFKDDIPLFVDELIKEYRFSLLKNADQSDKQLLIGAGKSPHELLSCLITLSEYSSILEKFKVNPKNIAAMIIGKVAIDVPSEYRTHYKVLASIVNSSIDADKFDYILRDNYMCGALLTIIDKERLLSTYAVTKDNVLYFNKKGLSLISNLINARQLVYTWIYQQHKVAYTDSLIRRIIQLYLDSEPDETKRREKRQELFSKKAILNLIDDYSVINKLRECAKNDLLQKMYNRFATHNFLKSCWKNAIEYHSKITDETAQRDLLEDVQSRPEKVEEFLQKKLTIDKNNIFSSYTHFVPFSPTYGLDIVIDVDGVPKSATKQLGYGKAETQKGVPGYN